MRLSLLRDINSREATVSKSMLTKSDVVSTSVLSLMPPNSAHAHRLLWPGWEGTITITVTIYFINPSGKLKLSFDRTTKNISQIMNHTHLSYTYAPFFSQISCIH